VSITLPAHAIERAQNTRSSAENFPETPLATRQELSRLLYGISEPWAKTSPARGFVRQVADRLHTAPLSVALNEAASAHSEVNS
jgi:hypothetical protein